LIIALLYLPLLLNLLYNFFIEDKSYATNNYKGLLNVLIGFLFAIFVVQVGKIVQNLLNLHYVSTGVVIFLLSFYAIDKTFMVIMKNFSFKNSFTVTLICWIVFILLKYTGSYRNVIYSILTYIFSFIVLKLTNLYISISTESLLTSDEKYFWLPVSKDIFEDNLFIAITNNPIQSYGLLVGHTHAVLNNFFTYSSDFLYLPAYKNIFFFLTVYFIYECRNSTKSRLIVIIFITTIALTSDWFTYLFFNSLLAESVSSYFFGILVIELFRNKNNSFILISLGFLYFSKQFISIFSILIGIYIIFKNKDSIVKYFLLIFGVSVDLVNSVILKTPITWSFYLNSLETDAATKDGINVKNIINIVVQFLIDKPMSYFILIILLLSVFVNIKKGAYELELLLIIVLNTIFVFFLYVFIWSNVEYESSYRYLLNIFHIIIFYFLITLDSFLSFKK